MENTNSFTVDVTSPCTGISFNGLGNSFEYYIEDEPLMIDLAYTITGSTSCAVNILVLQKESSPSNQYVQIYSSFA